MPPQSQPSPSTPPSRVEYHSYLLRVRRVTDGGREKRQAWLRDIPSNEEFYFKSLGELVDYLQAQRTLHWDMAWNEDDEVED